VPFIYDGPGLAGPMTRALGQCTQDALSRAFFQASIACVLWDGHSTFFWCDPWLDDQRIRAVMPDLVDAIPARAQRRRMVASALAQHAWIQDITGALTSCNTSSCGNDWTPSS
jgi:hypothetical protein